MKKGTGIKLDGLKIKQLKVRETERECVYVYVCGVCVRVFCHTKYHNSLQWWHHPKVF